MYFLVERTFITTTWIFEEEKKISMRYTLYNSTLKKCSLNSATILIFVVSSITANTDLTPITTETVLTDILTLSEHDS